MRRRPYRPPVVEDRVDEVPMEVKLAMAKTTMAAIDSLPREWRQFIHECPYQIPPLFAVAVFNQWGGFLGLGKLKEQAAIWLTANPTVPNEDAED